MASCVFSKEDIDILTNNILENRAEILQTLYDAHTEIDPAWLYSNYRHKLHPPPTEDASASDGAFEYDEPISVDDFEEIYNAMDEIDKKLPDLPKSAEFKEPKGLRRYNSKNDIADKTMSASMTNLTLIKKVTATAVAPPPPAPEPPKPSVKLTDADLIEFNALKGQIRSQMDAIKLNSCDKDPFGLVETGRKLAESFDRLQKFFDEIIPLTKNSVRTEIKTEMEEGSTVWDTLDTQWIESLRKLSEVKSQNDVRLLRQIVYSYLSLVLLQIVSQIKILKKARDMYRIPSELQQIDLPLSDCISELLERL